MRMSALLAAPSAWVVRRVGSSPGAFDLLVDYVFSIVRHGKKLKGQTSLSLDCTSDRLPQVGKTRRQAGRVYQPMEVEARI